MVAQTGLKGFSELFWCSLKAQVRFTELPNPRRESRDSGTNPVLVYLGKWEKKLRAGASKKLWGGRVRGLRCDWKKEVGSTKKKGVVGNCGGGVLCQPVAKRCSKQKNAAWSRKPLKTFCHAWGWMRKLAQTYPCLKDGGAKNMLEEDKLLGFCALRPNMLDHIIESGGRIPKREGGQGRGGMDARLWLTTQEGTGGGKRSGLKKFQNKNGGA